MSELRKYLSGMGEDQLVQPLKVFRPAILEAARRDVEASSFGRWTRRAIVVSVVMVNVALVVTTVAVCLMMARSFGAL